MKKDEEKIVFIKYPKEKENELLNFIKKQHPYKVPELITLNPDSVDDAYLDRVIKSTN
ncbi:divalent cation tolerance protein CutA [bacterium]|nr:divalent cation tolerance protein CutA [bacterium]